MSLPASRGLMVPGPTPVLEPNDQRTVLRLYLHRASERSDHHLEYPILASYLTYTQLSQERAIEYTLSRVMLDYWISFAVSLTPNDGKGTNSMF
jgi:hypothetical protein